MKFQKFIVLLLFLTTGSLFAQNTDLLVKDIISKSKIIKDNIDIYDNKITQVLNESTEGGMATAYCDKAELKLIQIIWFGEIGKNIIEYYFDQDQLIFVSTQDFNYNRPIYFDQKTPKNIVVNEVYDPDKTTVKENRFYFNNEKLFLWYNNDKQEIDITLEQNVIKGEKLLVDANRRKEALKK
ncbi:MAG: hypothetical protein ABFR32_03350 [Bacteroidota bacterium]